MPKSLKDKLQAARGQNSLNTEIVERLERSLDPDPALQIAEILRPLMATLDEADQAKLVDLAASAVKIIAKADKRKKPRK